MNLYEPHPEADPKLPFICHTDTVRMERPKRNHHWQENVEILSMVRGEGTVTVGEASIPFGEGDTIVIPPNRLHGFFSEKQGMKYHCLIVYTSFFRENHLALENYSFPERIRDPELSAAIDAFAEAWKEEDGAPTRVARLRADALEIVLRICEEYGEYRREPMEESHLLGCVKQGIAFLRAESARDLSLDEVADFVGLSKYYFAHAFRRIIGYAPMEYLNVIRCEKAKELLVREPGSIGAVGRACGFSSQSYFSQIFRAHTGETPTAYRNRSREKR